ncbi:MAG: redox-sensing transcriptional repressor Rex [Candidatus Omnitrophica bacterium]|nr:redox-sensing transcriptional repressor Rex [Candidatus Omnitrophota bacterium]
MKKNNIGKNFSLDSIRRLTLYLRNLRKIKKQGIEVISSDKITRLLNVTPSQFRKDLSYFGEFGKRGVGYNVAFLIEEIQKIVGSHIDWNIALVGLGKLGGALLGFEGFSKFNIKIKAVFDSDKKKIGKIKNGIMIEAVDSLRELIKKNKIKVAIISTPPEVAQNIAEQLIDSGVKGIQLCSGSIESSG